MSEQCRTKIEKLKDFERKLITSIQDLINKHSEYKTEISYYYSTCELLRSCNQQLAMYSDYLNRCNALIKLLEEKKNSRNSYKKHNRSVTNNFRQKETSSVNTEDKDDAILSTTKEGVWVRVDHY